LPSEKSTVEFLGGGLVGGGEFDPTEGAGLVFFDVGHGKKL
jgi:hypothetical protein